MRKVFNPISVIFLLSVLIGNSCYYDNKEELYPVYSDAGCDTTDVEFSEDILPIIYGHCYNCHSESKHTLYGGNISLENYTEIKKTADDGSFTGSISYGSEYIGMPFDYQLDSCLLKKADIWVRNGAHND